LDDRIIEIQKLEMNIEYDYWYETINLDEIENEPLYVLK
jgi:hypothetical protein